MQATSEHEFNLDWPCGSKLYADRGKGTKSFNNFLEQWLCISVRAKVADRQLPRDP
jgi:hypothetical protein